MKIIICTSDPAQRDILGTWFHQNGWQVITCSTLGEAADQVKAEGSDAALIDPREDGSLHKARNVMNIFWHYGCRVAFLTTRLVESELREAWELQPDMIFQLPVDFTDQLPIRLKTTLDEELARQQGRLRLIK